MCVCVERRGGAVAGERAEAEARVSKKQSLGFGGRSGACSFPPSPRRWLVFSARTRRSADVDGMSADRAQEAAACLF